MQTIKNKKLSRSLLKGTVLNLGLQLANRNLSKNNFWQTLLVGAAGGFGDLPIYRQTKEYVGCTHATLISIAKYLGYNTTDLEKEERNLGENDGSDFYQLAKQKGFNVAYIDNDIRKVGLKLQQNCPAAITYNPVSGGNPHTVAINKIEYQKNINNPKRTRYLIKTMNPLYSTWYTLSETEFMNGRIRIIKH